MRTIVAVGKLETCTHKHSQSAITCNCSGRPPWAGGRSLSPGRGVHPDEAIRRPGTGTRPLPEGVLVAHGRGTRWRSTRAHPTRHVAVRNLLIWNRHASTLTVRFATAAI